MEKNALMKRYFIEVGERDALAALLLQEKSESMATKDFDIAIGELYFQAQFDAVVLIRGGL